MYFIIKGSIDLFDWNESEFRFSQWVETRVRLTLKVTSLVVGCRTVTLADLPAIQDDRFSPSINSATFSGRKIA